MKLNIYKVCTKWVSQILSRSYNSEQVCEKYCPSIHVFFRKRTTISKILIQRT